MTRVLVFAMLSLISVMVPGCGDDDQGNPIAAPTRLFASALAEANQFTARSAGTYRFTVTNGAYQNCPPGADPTNPFCGTWTTDLLVFKDRAVDWSGPNPSLPTQPNPANWDFRLGDAQARSTYEAAEESGRGTFVEIPLETNDYVVLVAQDCKGCFVDNVGGIQLEVRLVP